MPGPVDGGTTIRIILRNCHASEGKALTSASFIEWAIVKLCKFLNMTKVGIPFSQSIPPGISCGLIIAESHLFIHTWPETSSVRVVIDSCVEFDHNAASEWLKETFEAEKYEYSMTWRQPVRDWSERL